MKIKDQNSSYTWPSRVREYDAIPNRSISREESWKKLRLRLDRAPKRKNRTWYWVAAASLILFMVITICIAERNKTIQPAFVKTPAVLKQNNNAPVAADPLEYAGSTPAKTCFPDTKTTFLTHINKLRLIPAKKENSLLPVPNDSIQVVASDTMAIAHDMAQPGGRLPIVHINDLINSDTAPEHITIEGLAVKKMIRWFGIDFTKEQPSKKQEKMPANPYSIPDNLN